MALKFVREQLATSIINASLLDTDAVETAKIASSAVTTAKIGNDQVTDDKINLGAGTYDFSSGSAVLRANTPSGSSDVATKAYVDNEFFGYAWKKPVRLASTANLAATYNGGTKRLTANANGALSLDSVAVANGNRVLIKDQSTQSNNGVYSVIEKGDGSTPYVLERVSDMDASAEFASAAMFVQEGTTLSLEGFVCAEDAGFVMDTDECAFSQFTGLGSITAGAGLSKSGNVLSAALTAQGGLAFNTAGNSGTLELDLLSTGALQLTSGELGIKVHASAPGLEIDAANGIRVKRKANAGIAADANGIEVLIEAAKGLSVGASGLATVLESNKGLSVGASGLAVVIDSNFMIMNGNAISIKDDSLTLAKQKWRFKQETASRTSDTSYSVTESIPAAFLDGFQLYRNGQLLKQAGSPADNSEYSVSGTTITIGGSGIPASESLIAVYAYES